MTFSEDDSAPLAIRDSHLFRSIDEVGKQRLFASATSVSFEADQVIVKEGDPGDALFVIKDGTVAVHTSHGADKVPLASLSPGACFGEVALLTQRPRTATVIATSPCTLLCFARAEVERVLSTYPELRKLLESVVLGRAQDTIDKLTKPLSD